MKERFIKFFRANYIITENGKIKLKDKMLYVDKFLPATRFNSQLATMGEEEVPEDEIRVWIDELLAQAKPAPKGLPKRQLKGLSIPANWIYEQLNLPTCPYSLSKRADMIMFRNQGIEVSSNDKRIIGWLTLRVRDLGLKKEYTNGEIEAGWSELKEHFLTTTIAGLRDQIAYTGSNYIDTFIHQIYDYLQIKEDYDIFEMLFKHWLWCLKRRICGMPLVWHIWLNFNGGQGIGKTQLITRMFKILEEFKVETSLRIMNDLDREYRKFTDNYIIFFDELNTGENSDSEVSLNDSAVDAIKQIMTQETFTVRQFQTQDQNKVRNTFVPISCANKHLYDIIYDGDAMRRWFEFNCQRTSAPDSYDEINAILERFPEALQGIDESINTGYWIKGSETDKKIVDIQKHYLPTNTSTNTWIDYCHVTPDFDRASETALKGPEYKQYTNYCRSVGKHAAGLQRVTMIIARLWPECIDDEGFAHVYIESKVDETTGELIINDITKLKPVPLTTTAQKSIFKSIGVNDFD